MFEDIRSQKGESLQGGGIMIDNSEHNKMSSFDFSAMAHEKQKQFFGDNNPSIAEEEDLHWAELWRESKIYAMNNPLSLFGDDCQVWNLDRFTSYESLIHYVETYHNYEVCLHYFLSETFVLII